MPNDISMSPLNETNEAGETSDGPLTATADAISHLNTWSTDYLEPNDDLDPDVRRIEADHAAELDRLISTPIRVDDPDFDQRASDRRADVYAHQKLLPAVGAEPIGGFIEPESSETYVPGPRASVGFKVTTLKRRRKTAGD